jgi:hypothetical protein
MAWGVSINEYIQTVHYATLPRTRPRLSARIAYLLLQ